MSKNKQNLNSKMEKSKSGFCLTEASPSDNKNFKSVSSPRVNLSSERGLGLSPPIGPETAELPNTGCSIGEGSVFTFNSVTDESSDEKKSEPPSPNPFFDEGATFASADVNSSVSLLGDSRNEVDGTHMYYHDKKCSIKMVLRKEYTHVVRYNYPALLEKLKEIQAFEEAEKLCQTNKESQRQQLLTGVADVSGAGGGLPPFHSGIKGSSKSPQLGGPNHPQECSTSKEKFSSRVLKNFFSMVTSPVADRKAARGQTKKSKSSSSPSLTKFNGAAGSKGGPQSLSSLGRGGILEVPNEASTRASQLVLEIKKEGITV